MKFRRPNLNSRWIPYTVATCAAVTLYVVLTHLSNIWQAFSRLYSYVSPVLIGIAVAYLLNPVVNFFAERCFGRLKHRRLARGLGLIITVLLLLATLALILWSIIPHLVENLERLVSNLDVYVAQVQKQLERLSERFEFLQFEAQDTQVWTNLLKKALSWLPENLPAILDASVQIGSGVVNAVVIFIIALYILMDKDRLLRGVKKAAILFLSPKTYTRLRTFFRQCNSIVLRYFGSDLLDSLIVGVANVIFMLIARMPYVALISVIVGVTNLLPTFGPIIGAVPSALILLLVDPWTALWFIVWTLILQTIDGYVIKPLLHGDTMGLPAVWILVSIIVGGRIFGVLGLLLAIPFAAICSYLLDKIISKKQLRVEAQLAAEQPDSADAEGKEQPQDEQHDCNESN